jgi:hypothetical protein
MAQNGKETVKFSTLLGKRHSVRAVPSDSAGNPWLKIRSLRLLRPFAAKHPALRVAKLRVDLR